MNEFVKIRSKRNVSVSPECPDVLIANGVPFPGHPLEAHVARCAAEADDEG
jgi:hypothetical protein